MTCLKFISSSSFDLKVKQHSNFFRGCCDALNWKLFISPSVRDRQRGSLCLAVEDGPGGGGGSLHVVREVGRQTRGRRRRERGRQGTVHGGDGRGGGV